MLVDVTIDYLADQIAAGADMVQLFESWAASLQGAEFERWCVKPVQAIIAGLRDKGLTTPVIGFPRGAQSPLEAYARQTRCDVLALDTHADLRLLAFSCSMMRRLMRFWKISQISVLYSIWGTALSPKHRTIMSRNLCRGLERQARWILCGRSRTGLRRFTLFL